MAEVCTEPRSDQGKGRAKRKGRCNEKPGISLSRPGPVFTGMEMRSRGEASGPLPQPGVKANGGAACDARVATIFGQVELGGH